MFSKGRKQTAVLTLLVLLVVSAPAGAAPLPDGTFFSTAWSWMQLLWVEAGPCIDPDGRCAAGGAPSSLDGGACIDPNGRCMPGSAPSQLDQGPCIEPNGGCAASFSG